MDGPFTNVQAAVDAAVAGGVPARIRIGRGTWHGSVDVPPGAPPLTIVGAGMASTVLAQGHVVLRYRPHTGQADDVDRPPTLSVRSDDFRAERLSIGNNLGPGGRAVALRVDGTRAAFDQVTVLGHRNALDLPRAGSLVWFRNCRIEGSVDYIVGAAIGLFHGCALHSDADGPVTAASTPADQTYGFVLRRCRLAASAGKRVYLGRAAGPHAAVLFVDSAIDAPVHDPGWHDGDMPQVHATARFANVEGRGAEGLFLPETPWTREAPAVPTPEMLFGDWRPFE